MNKKRTNRRACFEAELWAQSKAFVCVYFPGEPLTIMLTFNTSLIDFLIPVHRARLFAYIASDLAQVYDVRTPN